MSILNAASSVSMRAPEIDLNFIDKNEKSQEYDLEEVINKDVSTNQNFYHKIVYPNVFLFIALHTCAFIGVYHLVVHAKILTILWCSFLGFCSGEAIALGAHRYYSHKSFKASTSFRVAMLVFQLIAGQNSMYTWARDHRVHHKYSDTDADPHNASRGFVFSHFGWLLFKKHPLVKEKTKCINVSDLRDEKLLMFQHNHFVPLYIVIGFLCPIFIPVLVWNENPWTSFFVSYCLRYVIILHLTWSVNSFAHMLGSRPYDKRLEATDSNLVASFTGGDGWHNYHHSFPWDAKAGEFSIRGGFNTKLLMKFVEYGFASDLKTASDTVVEGHTRRHGDGTHPIITPNKEERRDWGKIKNKDEDSVTNRTEENVPKTD